MGHTGENPTILATAAEGRQQHRKWLDTIDAINRKFFIPSHLNDMNRQNELTAFQSKSASNQQRIDMEIKKNQDFVGSSFAAISEHVQKNNLAARSIPNAQFTETFTTVSKIESELANVSSSLTIKLHEFKLVTIKANGCLAAFLFVMYVIPGIIYLVYNNSKKTKFEEAYSEILHGLSYMNYLLIQYKDLARIESQLQMRVLLNRLNDERNALLGNADSGVDGILAEWQAGFVKSGLVGLPWNAPEWKQWNPALGYYGESVLGTLNIQVESSQRHRIPLLTNFTNGKGLLLKATTHSMQGAMSGVKSMLLRLLATTRPGFLEFTILDPIGLGGNVRDFIALGDFVGKLINHKIWSEPDHISKRLAEIVDKITVINHRYLRDDFESIEDYNEKADEIAEPYHILLVLDFPINFKDEDFKRLLSIYKNGPRCGIYPIVLQDASLEIPYRNSLLDIENSAIVFDCTGTTYHIEDKRFEHYTFEFDQMPEDVDFTKRTILSVAGAAKDEVKVEVPFSRILTRAGTSEDCEWKDSTIDRFEIPLGPTGANKIQHLVLDSDMSTSVLVVGRPGSGKGNMAMILITALSLKYSPKEAQLYLIDLKKGVDYKVFADCKLPHAKVIAIDSDREYALTVIAGLHEEMERRGDLLRTCSAKKLSEYREKSGKGMPRILMMVEEFQKLFAYNDKVAIAAAKLLESLIREGRYVGIHLFLSTQSLNNVMIPKSILDLIGVRIAFQCSEAESRVILSPDNLQASMLTRAGEAIYNGRGGMVDANIPFQVAKYEDKEGIRYLDAIKAHAAQRGLDHDPIVFVGDDPVELDECMPLQRMLKREGTCGSVPRVWLGKPFTLDESISISFTNEYGSHLAVIDMQRRTTSNIMVAAFCSLILQRTKMNLRIFIISFEDRSDPVLGFFQKMSCLFPDEIRIINRQSLPSLLESQAQRIRLGIDGIAVDRIEHTVLFFESIHHVRDLFLDNDSEVTEPLHENFSMILKEGPMFGLHVIFSSDTHRSLEKVIDNRRLREVDYRIVGRSNPNQSIALTGDSHAANIERENRLILTDIRQPDNYELFIPYNSPDEQLVRQITATVTDTEGG